MSSPRRTALTCVVRCGSWSECYFVGRERSPYGEVGLAAVYS